MGINSSLDEFGQEFPVGSNNGVHYPANWRDSIIKKRPKRLSPKRAVMLLTLDVIVVINLLGLIDHLNDWKQVLAFIIGVLYLAGRTGIIFFKLIVFIGKNSEWIKKGFRAIKEIIKE